MIVLAVLQVIGANSAYGRLAAIGFLICSVALAFAAYFEKSYARRSKSDD